MADVVLDTFTDTNDTDIESHTGETGATWTRDDIFGQGNGGGRTFGIFSNKLRRLTFAENSSGDGGNSLVRPSGLLGDTSGDYAVEITLTFSAGGGNATIELYENAINPGNGERLFTFGQGMFNTNVTGGTDPSFSISTGVEYVVLMSVTGGTNFEFYIDDVLIDSGTRASDLIEPFGINIFDGGSDGDVNINGVRIYTLAPPGAFWTDYKKTTETIV